MNALLEIRDQYNGLSKTNKKIADFVLKNADKCLNMTALEIAEHCQTSSASIIRFAKTLGFSGLEPFKISIAQSQTGNEAIDFDRIISEEDSSKVLVDKVQALITKSNEHLFYQLNLSDLEHAVALTKKAQRVYILGIGASVLPAYDFYHKLRRINKRALFEFDVHMMVEFFQYITPDDVVLAISYSGQSREIIYPCEIAKQKGAKIISVTRNAPSPLRELTDICLTVPENEHLIRVGAITSKYSSMLICDLLYFGIIQKDIKVIEKSLIDTGLLTRKLKIEK